MLYLGYQHSIWGDVAGRVVSRLAALGARRVAYIGKVGALDPAIAPNTCLATGDTSILDDGLVRRGMSSPTLPTASRTSARAST